MNMSIGKPKVESFQDDEQVEMGTLTADLKGLTSENAMKRLEEYGRNEVVEKSTSKWVIFGRQFTGLMPIMIEIAAFLSLINEDWTTFGVIAGMLLLNALIGFKEETKSMKSIDKLKDNLVTYVAVRRDDTIQNVDTSEIVPGDIVFLRAGCVVPADGEWCDGDRVAVDTSALTGESLPRKVPSDDDEKVMHAGSVIREGECYLYVTATGPNTVIGEASVLVQDRKEEAGQTPCLFEMKIMQFVKLVILATVFLIVIIVLIELLRYKEQYRTVLLSAMTIIIASIPIALPVVIKVTQALGAVKMAKEDAIVTHLSALQEIASMSVLCSDKTGTLTTASLSIYKSKIYARPGFTKEQVLLYAALASNADNVNDPIDSAVLTSFSDNCDACDESEQGDQAGESLSPESRKSKRVICLRESCGYQITRQIGFTPITKRSVALGIEKDTNQEIAFAKGLCPKILVAGGDDGEIQWECIDSQKERDAIKKQDENFGKRGYKTIGVAVGRKSTETDEFVWQFVGLIPMLDPPREDTCATLDALKDAGLRIKMITGDHGNIAKETSALIGLGQDIIPCSDIAIPSQATKLLIRKADGFSEALPKDKLEIVATLQNDKQVVGMTGDGVNDAPALAQAQIGIAVQGATDAARAAADIVLTKPGLRPIYTAVVESRKIFQRVRAYILYRMASTVQLVCFLSYLILAYRTPLPPTYVIILALLNDVVTLTLAFDHAVPSKSPDIPKVSDLAVSSFFYGFFLLLQAIIFHEEMHNILDDHLYHQDIEHGSRFGAMYLQLAISMLLLIFSTRTRGLALINLPCIGLGLSVFVGCLFSILYTGLGAADHVGWKQVGIIVGYDFGCFVLMDVIKVIVYRYLSNSSEGLLVRDLSMGDSKVKSTKTQSFTIDMGYSKLALERVSTYPGPPRTMFRRNRLFSHPIIQIHAASGEMKA